MISRFKRYFEYPEAFAFPERVTLELTNLCNLRCSFCPRHFSHSPQGTMDFDLFAACIDEIAGHPGVAVVPFFRGESLLHPKFLEMMHYAKERGVGPIQLATNGVLLSEEIGREILDLGLDFISFSLDTIDQKLYEELRPGGDYAKVQRNVLRFLELRAGHPNPRTQVQVSAVETDRTRPARTAITGKLTIAKSFALGSSSPVWGLGQPHVKRQAMLSWGSVSLEPTCSGGLESPHTSVQSHDKLKSHMQEVCHVFWCFTHRHIEQFGKGFSSEEEIYEH